MEAILLGELKKHSTSSTFSMGCYSVHECALESDRIVEVLVKFYNVVLKHNHYPHRWLKVVDAMLVKGKGLRLKNPKMLKMIETDLQLVMRTHLGSRMNERVDSDNRASKRNCGSSKRCSIENALLEKILTFDHAKKNRRTKCVHHV